MRAIEIEDVPRVKDHQDESLATLPEVSGEIPETLRALFESGRRDAAAARAKARAPERHAARVAFARTQCEEAARRMGMWTEDAPVPAPIAGAVATMALCGLTMRVLGRSRIPLLAWEGWRAERCSGGAWTAALKEVALLTTSWTLNLMKEEGVPVMLAESAEGGWTVQLGDGASNEDAQALRATFEPRETTAMHTDLRPTVQVKIFDHYADDVVLDGQMADYAIRGWLSRVAPGVGWA